MELICPNCGGQLESDSGFESAPVTCPHCGEASSDFKSSALSHEPAKRRPILWVSFVLAIGSMIAIWMGRDLDRFPVESVVSELQLESPGNLEIDTIRVVQTWNRKTWRTFAGAPFPGTTAISRIQVPATYRFFVKMSEVAITTETSIKGLELVVVAPPPQPELPVAFNTNEVISTIKAELFRGDADLKELEQKLSDRLAEAALIKAETLSVRERGRTFLAKHLIDLLIALEQDSRFISVRIRYSDEKAEEVFPISSGLIHAPQQ